jgi:hypothetical protein
MAGLKSVTNLATRACLLTGALILLAPAARGDAGTLRVSKQTRDLDVSIFTDPTPVYVGTLDVSILVQPRPGAPRQPIPVFRICAHPVNKPDAKKQCDDRPRPPLNQLFQAAQLEMTEPGLWLIEVEMDSGDGGLRVQFELPVEDGYATRESYGLWIGLPVVAIVVYFVHRRLDDRRRRPASPPTSTAPSDA